MERSRYERGLEKFRQIDGKGGKKAVDDLKEIVPEIERYIVEYPFGDIYSRPGLDLKIRELAAISALTTMGNAEPQLKVHIHSALNNGATREEVVEVILQMSVYAGFPAAINALYTAREIFRGRDEKGKS
ncbi:MAG TPA: carboxymuconolactone decarboxylase family protein [Candidatus Krumholzibacteriaceae bacterium]|nr:carboxymuconolactone decarboxylase family protein [Candidatus Krumholzibacteriaceae bacterium]